MVKSINVIPNSITLIFRQAVDRFFSDARVASVCQFKFAIEELMFICSGNIVKTTTDYSEYTGLEFVISDKKVIVKFLKISSDINAMDIVKEMLISSYVKSDEIRGYT